MNINDEIFCLRFELETLSSRVNYNKSERWVKGFVAESTENAHLDRYEFIKDFVENRSVLDIACGAGYGSFIISEKAKDVIGVDLDVNAIKYGNLKYPKSNINRIVADATEFKNSESFDCIVSFETIEHIPNYMKFIQNLYDNLAENGVLYISTPITPITNNSPQNPYHVIEWNFFDFHNLFVPKFKINNIYTQNIRIQPKKVKDISLFQRVINRIFNRYPSPIPEIKKAGIHKYIENEFNMDKCYFGYQILELTKK